MGNNQTLKRRKRLLMIACHLDPDQSMESRLGWFRAVQASEDYHVTLVGATAAAKAIDFSKTADQLDIELLPYTRFERLLMGLPGCFYLAYRLWHRRVYRRACQIHEGQPFDLVHQVSFCGFREPGECWRLEAPFVWGPLGGTQNVPANFLSRLGGFGALSEASRSLVNYCQLNFSPRVKQAMRKASVVLAANREVQRALGEAHRRELICQLETGVESVQPHEFRRRKTGEPLRILWAGRLESWKALPLLLRALAKLPSEVRYELRVVGAGSCEQKWKRLADRLGLEGRVHWAGWPIYANREEHYQWADLFAFTSLRDTSGTGLLESLAAGVPILGLDHQGAGDVMTAESAVPIAVNSAPQVIDDMRDAVFQLANDPQRLDRLSRGAYERSEYFLWGKLANEMAQLYRDALGIQSAVLVEKKDPGSGYWPELPTSVSSNALSSR